MEDEKVDVTKSLNENRPFNDVIDHFNKIEGNASKNLAKTNLKKLPRPIKYIGYFIFAFFTISILIIVILNLLN